MVLIKTSNFEKQYMRDQYGTGIQHIITAGLIAVLDQYELFPDRNTRDNLAWTIVKWDPSHARGVSVYTSSMVTARVKQEEETDTRVIARE